MAVVDVGAAGVHGPGGAVLVEELVAADVAVPVEVFVFGGKAVGTPGPGGSGPPAGAAGLYDDADSSPTGGQVADEDGGVDGGRGQGGAPYWRTTLTPSSGCGTGSSHRT